MASFNGRRAPNVSQYIANLNTIPSANDMPQQDFSILDDDLALFTNTQFFDFDMNEPVPDLQPNMKFDASSQGQTLGQDAGNNNNNNLNFANQPNMNFDDFTWMQQQQQQQQQHPRAASIHSGQRSLPPSPPNGLPLANAGQQSQPTIPSAFHFAQIQSGPQTGDKRNASTASLTSPANGEYIEEGSRIAAEEDKRRRNTAASARFRVKKKQREQALEKTAKDMSDKVALLEARVGQLEMENQWLKGLITEKNLKAAEKERAASEDGERVAPIAKKTKVVDAEVVESEAGGEEDVERSLDEKKRGVGTESVAVEA